MIRSLFAALTDGPPERIARLPKTALRRLRGVVDDLEHREENARAQLGLPVPVRLTVCDEETALVLPGDQRDALTEDDEG